VLAWKIGFSALSILALAGCGGGGSGTDNSPGSGTTYAFVAPLLNSSRVYAETIVDNSNNTIDIGFSQTVNAVSADGSVTELEESTTGVSAIVNGTDYAMATESENFNSNGQETSYINMTVVPSVTCTYDPHGDGPDWPLQVGQTWSINFTFTCGAGTPVSYTQSGSVVDVEMVTVPAGTFTAIKLQSTVTWTDSEGTARTQTITNWRDVATSHSVKQVLTIAVSGVLPSTGYAVSRQILLESTS
jgi:hypothetical protein